MWELLLYIDEKKFVRYKNIDNALGDSLGLDNWLDYYIDILFKADLIRIKDAPIKDFEVICISAKGMEAARRVKEINKLQEKLDEFIGI